MMKIINIGNNFLKPALLSFSGNPIATKFASASELTSCLLF